MKTVYVVFGSQGEYSDRETWVEAVYDNRKEAEKHEFEAHKNSLEIDRSYDVADFIVLESELRSEFSPDLLKKATCFRCNAPAKKTRSLCSLCKQKEEL